MAKDLENHTCMSQFQAEIASRMLYIKGYRKASDVARETIAEAIKILKEKCLLTVRNDGAYCFEKEDVLFWLRTIPLKMEKKYTEGGE